jgi:hypothetical protein
MVAPVAIIALVGEVMRYPYLMWLVTGLYPLMCLGMIAEMIYRRECLTTRDVHPHGLGSIAPSELSPSGTPQHG